MAETKEISVGFTFTKNLGNFESLKVDASVVEAGEEPEAVYDKAWKSVRSQIKNGLDVAKGGFLTHD